MLTAVSKKAAHFTVFVKCFFENSYKKLGPAFLRDPAFLNLVTLGNEPGPNVYYRTESYQNPPRLFSSFPAAAEADNLKLHHIQFQIISTKRKNCAFTNLAQMLPFVFLRIGGKLHFYSLGTAVRRKLQVSRGMQSLWLRVSNRGEKRPVGTRFCSQSLVCYTFCDR